jgi:hypothetical protein
MVGACVRSLTIQGKLNMAEIANIGNQSATVGQDIIQALQEATVDIEQAEASLREAEVKHCLAWDQFSAELTKPWDGD